MTAEIAVLNKDAVALAADSTVTVSGRKAYHTTNKLFSLSQNQPVGIMVYGSAELVGVPWETIIKLFRKSIGEKELPYLSDYKDEFTKFIQTKITEYSKSEIEDLILEYTEDYLEVLIEKIDSAVENLINMGLPTNKKDIKPILAALINDSHENWMKKERLPLFTEDHESKIIKKHQEAIFKLVNEKLENHKTTKHQKNLICNTCIRIFCSKNSEVSGIVFAGFGKNEIFPGLIQTEAECVIEGVFKHEFKEIKISNGSNEASAAIVPFAQTDTVSAFVEGASSIILKEILKETGRAIDSYLKLLINGIEDKACRDTLENAMAEQDNIAGMKPILREVYDRIKHVQYKHHIRPMIEAIQFLPKNEMAEVAESLVSITSFRQKVSLEQESVGGAIDVAVISKTDGFIWIKRKHYFSAELNPMYMSRFGGNQGE